MAQAKQHELSDTLHVTATRTATVVNLMQLKVVTPAQVVFEGTAHSLVAPAWDGLVGILPGHAPFLTLLGSGRLEIDSGSDARQSFGLSGGVMKVEDNQVTVLADRVDAS